MTTEEWLHQIQAEECCYGGNEDFKRVGGPICDAIILPKCNLLFRDHKYSDYRSFLVQ